MIKEQDLHEAIAECHGTRNPDAKTCLKLAAYYTILDHVKAPAEPAFSESYSYDPPEIYSSDTEFGGVLRRKDLNGILGVIDELMDTLRIMEPRVYNAVMEKMESL